MHSEEHMHAHGSLSLTLSLLLFWYLCLQLLHCNAYLLLTSRESHAALEEP